MSTQEDMFFWIAPPTVGGMHQVQSFVTGGSADTDNWVTGLGADAPKGQVMLTLEASGEDVWVRFKASGSAGTTVTNGLLIKADQPGRSFIVSPTKHPIIDHIAAGVGTLQVQVSSFMGAREDI